MSAEIEGPGNTSISKNEKIVTSKSVTEIKADRSSDRYSDYSTESNESCVLITKKKTDPEYYGPSTPEVRKSLKHAVRDRSDSQNSTESKTGSLEESIRSINQSPLLESIAESDQHPNVENEVKGIKHQLQKSVNIPPAQYSRIDEVPSEMTTEGQADIENSDILSSKNEDILVQSAPVCINQEHCRKGALFPEPDFFEFPPEKLQATNDIIFNTFTSHKRLVGLTKDGHICVSDKAMKKVVAVVAAAELRESCYLIVQRKWIDIRIHLRSSQYFKEWKQGIPDGDIPKWNTFSGVSTKDHTKQDGLFCEGSSYNQRSCTPYKVAFAENTLRLIFASQEIRNSDVLTLANYFAIKELEDQSESLKKFKLLQIFEKKYSNSLEKISTHLASIQSVCSCAVDLYKWYQCNSQDTLAKKLQLAQAKAEQISEQLKLSSSAEPQPPFLQQVADQFSSSWHILNYLLGGDDEILSTISLSVHEQKPGYNPILATFKVLEKWIERCKINSAEEELTIRTILTALLLLGKEDKIIVEKLM